MTFFTFAIFDNIADIFSGCDFKVLFVIRNFLHWNVIFQYFFYSTVTDVIWVSSSKKTTRISSTNLHRPNGANEQSFKVLLAFSSPKTRCLVVNHSGPGHHPKKKRNTRRTRTEFVNWSKSEDRFRGAGPIIYPAVVSCSWLWLFLHVYVVCLLNFMAWHKLIFGRYGPVGINNRLTRLLPSAGLNLQRHPRNNLEIIKISYV